MVKYIIVFFDSGEFFLIADSFSTFLKIIGGASHQRILMNEQLERRGNGVSVQIIDRPVCRLVRR